MNRLMYSGLRWFRLMKCSKLLLSTFWNSLSLLKASEMILQGQGYVFSYCCGGMPSLP